jgi:predicted short-subunit dehydrogenase-like oxidoreductase (DUF2520 family)
MGRALQACGVPIDFIASRNSEHAEAAAAFIGGDAVAVSYQAMASQATHVLIAVSDDAISSVANKLAAEGGILRVALHTCGSYGPELLAPLSEKGVSCGSMHPLQTISDGPQGASALRNIAFSISGSPASLAWAEHIIASLDGQALHVRDDSRHLYHAAAVMASNYVATLIDAAQELMEIAGISHEAALRALAPLVRTSVENCLSRGPINALTGPVVRGDAATITAHMTALKRADRWARNLYKAAGHRTLRMARQRGLGDEKSEAVRKALEGE